MALRIGPKPPPDPNKPKAKRKPYKKAAPRMTLPAIPTPQPTEPMPGFTSFAAEDYTVRSNSSTAAAPRFLTVSPLRAIMAEQSALDAAEHVPTARTREGVMYAAGLGLERKIIAMILGVEVEVLEQHYATELATAVHLLMNDIQTNLFNIARDPNHSQSVRSGMYLLGKLGNELYKEEKRSESRALVDPRTRTIDPSLLDDDQRDALRDILTAAMRLAQPGAGVVDGEYVEIEVDDAEDLL